MDEQKLQQEIGKLMGGQDSLRNDIKELTMIMGKSMDQIVATQKDILKVQIQHQANSEKINKIDTKLDAFIKDCEITKESVRKNSTFRIASLWVFCLIVSPILVATGTAVIKILGGA